MELALNPPILWVTCPKNQSLFHLGQKWLFPTRVLVLKDYIEIRGFNTCAGRICREDPDRVVRHPDLGLRVVVAAAVAAQVLKSPPAALKDKAVAAPASEEAKEAAEAGHRSRCDKTLLWLGVAAE
jgi:hypothetical protein